MSRLRDVSALTNHLAFHFLGDFPVSVFSLVTDLLKRLYTGYRLHTHIVLLTHVLRLKKHIEQLSSIDPFLYQS